MEISGQIHLLYILNYYKKKQFIPASCYFLFFLDEQQFLDLSRWRYHVKTLPEHAKYHSNFKDSHNLNHPNWWMKILIHFITCIMYDSPDSMSYKYVHLRELREQ